jgi:LuxR family maltose regulon positive regulatory protein
MKTGLTLSPDHLRDPLLKTKLFAPHLRPSLVSRPRLLSMVAEGEDRALTLICAPPGYGKTTLLAEWLASLTGNQESNIPTVGWLSLDEGDNDPIRFLNYLVAALENANVEMSAPEHTQLRTFQSTSLQVLLVLMINRIEDLAFPIHLVLDDYQFIANPEIHEGLTFLLDHLPSNLHLLIATRSDPLMPLHRLRARNQLVEVRAEDLRFTPDEVASFLNQVMRLSLSAEDISTLETRTEGWVTGLQMAALSMLGHPDSSQFIQSFSGNHRYILDYLAEEVLNRQPEGIQNFLMLTSLLDRFCAPLCAAILEQNEEFSQTTLQDLEHANLFLVALDNERQWYRYHHLFGELLQARIRHTIPALIPGLHTRASAWYEQNGWIDEAINHAIKAKDLEGTARLVRENILALLSRGQLATVMKWVELLPQESLLHEPVLCTRIASALTQAGRWYLTDTFIKNAEMAIKYWEEHPAGSNSENVRGLTPSTAQWIRTEITYVRAMSATYSGKSSDALALLHSLQTDLPDLSPAFQAWLHWAEGMAYRELGELEPALHSFSDAIRISSATGDVWWDFWADLGFTAHMAGNLSKAGVWLAEALSHAAEHDSVYQGNLGRVESYLSSVLLEQNNLEEAREHIMKAVEFIQWWPSQNSVPTTYAYLSLIYLASGDLGSATTAVERADQARRKGTFLQFAQCLVDEALVRVWLAQGDRASLEKWAGDMTRSLPLIEDDSTQIDRYQEVRLTMLARIWLENAEADRTRYQLEQALSLLTRLEKLTRAKGHGDTLMDVLTLKAKAFHARGSTAEALKILGECLSLAEDNGYIRVFLDAGQFMQDLLANYLGTPDLNQKAYAQRLIDAFNNASRSAPTEDSNASLVEPLTARELDVLRLMTGGSSNRQIAEKLVLAEGTVKFYVHVILEKLQVHSRTQAIAKARELKLV